MGSYIGYQELCRALHLEPMEVSEYKTITKVVGGLTNAFPTERTKDYTTTYRIPKLQPSYSQVEKPDLSSDQLTSYYTECADKKLNAVFFGDSMMWWITGMINYISNSFATVHYFRRIGIQEFDLDALDQADIVVLERIECALPSLTSLRFPRFD